jgi:hypothetical protein
MHNPLPLTQCVNVLQPLLSVFYTARTVASKLSLLKSDCIYYCSRQRTSYAVSTLRRAVYFFFFKLAKRQYSVIAKQYTTFLNRFFSIPVREYLVTRLRYYIDFSYLKAIIIIKYAFYYHLKLTLFLLYVIYQSCKFTYRSLRWQVTVSSYFLNIRRGYRQRLYMFHNFYWFVRGATRVLISNFFLLKPITAGTALCYLHSAQRRNCFYI